jgi:hypothetical protein
MRRYLVTGFCRLTGLWRDYVLATSSDEAVRIYCATYGMDPAQCAAAAVADQSLKTESLKTAERLAA